MDRPARVLLVAAVIGLAAAALAYYCAMHFCARQSAGSDELAWLRHEFRLSDAELQRIRLLHEGYLPKCREMCVRIAAKHTEVETALTIQTNGAPEVEQKLVELGTLRAQCQAQMLRHFEEVSHAMPVEQGQRYLSEMQRLTLGFHQQFEASMEGTPHSGHSHAGN